MSESLTGVTFLAFGNGSPDVFSTFAAMKSNSGSLAIGELIGAASFITSVVAGSMALIRPFTVARRSFVRDVGYFVVSVGFSMVVLADGRLNAWEASAMVCLYVFYVIMVVVWHWYRIRNRRIYQRNMAARTHFDIPENQELDIDEAPEDDEPEVAEQRSLLPATEDFEALERGGAPAWKENDEDAEDDETRNRYLAGIRDNMHVSRPVRNKRRRNTMNPIRPSLVGALEFQSVLSSLRKSKNIHLESSFDTDGPPAYQLDNRSVASFPHTGRRSSSFLSPPSGAARGRAVSANDAAGLQLDADLADRGAQTSSLSHPPTQTIEAQEEASSQSGNAQALEPPAALTVSPPAVAPQSEQDNNNPNNNNNSTSAISTPHIQPSDLLAPPGRAGVPTLQVETNQPTISSARSNQDADLGSPVVPFPSFNDHSPVSSRSPSIICPPPPPPPVAATPSELLQIHGRAIEEEAGTGTVVKWWPYRILPSPESLLSTLFPSLYGWTAKNIWERILGIIASPSVFLLTLTVPVIEPVSANASVDPVTVLVTPANDGMAPPVRLPEESPDFQALDNEFLVEQGEASASATAAAAQLSTPEDNPEAATQQEPPSSPPIQTKGYNRWLVMLQLFLGPFFITLIGWTTVDPDMNPRNLLAPSVISLLLSQLCLTGFILSTRHSNDGDHNHDSSSHLPNAWRPFLAFLGFVVAISWIATIATEVVNVLKTLGIILNISDSLLGLTVFAVGNSLGDLVADVTVARLGYPVMALSACFGGPMLNILLGVGLGGLFMTWNSPKAELIKSSASYSITVSKVLVISCATLLTTLVALLIAVPLNKWKMDRKIGWGLVVLWSVSTVGNVITEIVF